MRIIKRNFIYPVKRLARNIPQFEASYSVCYLYFISLEETVKGSKFRLRSAELIPMNFINIGLGKVKPLRDQKKNCIPIKMER